MGLFPGLENGRFADGRAAGGPDASRVRRRFRFSGTVQGVGFRCEARRAAGKLGLTGWARNERDGAVTVEAEGPAACAAEFLRALRSVPRFRIADVRAETLPGSGAETAFAICY